MINFARNGSRGIEVDKGVSLLLGKWICSFDVGEFGGGELSEASFGFKLLFFYNFGLIF